MYTPSDIIVYYFIKRMFLFLDEWLWYLALFLLFVRKQYYLVIIVLIAGFGCIYTSYHNLDLIEREILLVEQSVLFIDPFKKLI